ncbi:hypothetical protein PaeBR_17935 [Paenibacillus sp. BR2-3]|uniref:hypothetical protein n=1 Tax=Paenibacillus sp. BR2-3 TaxID=3048494 RepID=UPI0039774795
MDRDIEVYITNLRSQDRDLRYQAFLYIQSITNEKVDWAYDVWDSLKDDLTHPDNHRRAIAAQLLCNLAKSDPEGRMLSDFSDVLKLTKDKRFVTARHCIQSLWKVGLAGKQQKAMLIEGLAERFRNCIEWIETEDDLKYRKNMLRCGNPAVWK